VYDLEAEIRKRSLCATATATALAIAKPDACLASGVVYADVSSGSCPEPSDDSAISAESPESAGPPTSADFPSSA
jgi:hypothetical protein